MKPFLNRLFSRMVLVCLALILQIAIIAGMFTFLAETTPWVQLFFNVLALVLVLVIINRNGNPAYKIAWLVPILILPLFGTLLFCMFGRNKLSRRQIRRMKNVETEYIRAMDALPSARLELLAESPDAALQSGYLEKVAAAPVYRRTQSEFLKIGEDLYARMLQELKRAEKFIFLEYFIIEAGTMWDSILEILEEKARAGLDVRVIYDDFGCILKVPSDFNVQLEKKGIRCCAFHRFVPVLSASFNNRDHRKICVIDGNVGFTGASIWPTSTSTHASGSATGWTVA